MRHRGGLFLESQGAPAYAGVFTALCNLREAVPYAFGYMMSAKVGTGIVAELGAMRISEEIDALEVMGFDSMTFLCGTRLLASWIVLPFMYIAAIGVAYLASYIAVVLQIGYTSPGGYLLTFWEFQSPPDLLFSLIKGMTMATAIVLVGCYYGYNASGGPVGVGEATAKSMVLNLVLVTLIGMLGTQVFWGTNPHAPIGGELCHRLAWNACSRSARGRRGTRCAPLEPVSALQSTLGRGRAARVRRPRRSVVELAHRGERVAPSKNSASIPSRWWRAARRSPRPRSPRSGPWPCTRATW